LARTLSLDLGDGGLLGLAEGGLVLGPSPGCALVEGERSLFGEEARRRCRLSPRLVASDFWARLDTAPLGPPFPEGLSAADLVHAHLEGLWKTTKGGTAEVVLALPGESAAGVTVLTVGEEGVLVRHPDGREEMLSLP